MPRTPAGASEMVAVLERYCALTASAIDACDDGDDAALTGVLEARERESQRLSEFARDVVALRRTPRDDRSRRALEALLVPARTVAAQARVLDAALQGRALALRADIGVQLGRLSHDDSARSAYGAAAVPAGASRLDLRR